MSPPRLLLALLALLAVSACATRPPADDRQAVAEFRANNDPVEPFNRAMYDVNDAIDRAVLEPVARGYRAVVPPPVRRGITNVLSNARSPVVLANDALQGETVRFGTTLGRFLINSTIGIGGIFDVAVDLGLRPHSEDFGQTLAVAGVGEGPFLYLPLLGPSNPRDLVGLIAGILADPLTWLTFGNAQVAGTASYIRTGATVVSTREGLLDTIANVRATSLDPYATIRSAYRQSRAREIANTPEATPQPGAGLGSGFSLSPRR